MRLPQIIMIVLIGLDILHALIMHGLPKGKYDVSVTVIADLIMFAILSAGGFWGD